MPPTQKQQQAQPQKQPPPKQQQQYVPLKKRRPKVCADLEAAARTRDWSPQDLYYDPRYKSYFYAGTLPHMPEASVAQASVGTVTSEIQAFTGDPDMERRSILSRSRRGSRASRSRRRISFSAETLSSTSRLSQRRDPAPERAVCLAAAFFVLLLLLCLLLFMWTFGFLDDFGGDEQLSVSTFEPPTSSGKEGEQRTKEENATTETDNGDVKSKKKDARHANDSTTTENRKLHAPSERRWHCHDSTELAGDVCLYAHHSDDDTLGNYNTQGEGRSSLTHRQIRRCDVLIRCCYSVEDDMTLEMDTSLLTLQKVNSPHQHNLSTERRYSFSDYHSPLQTALVAVRARGSAFQRLLGTGGEQVRKVFVRNMLHVTQSSHYTGIRLWWPERDTGWITKAGFVRALRDLTTALRKVNCTLGFFLPYADHHHPAAYARMLRLLEGVFGSSQSLLLYPTTGSLLRNSLSSWTSPSQMVVVPGGRRPAVSSPGPSVCYLFLSATAISVVLSDVTTSCKVAEQGVVTKPMFLSRKGLSRLCRSWEPSWKMSSHTYHSIACRIEERDARRGGSKEAVAFQTPLQAWRYRKELLASARSSCSGFVDGDRGFPHACQFTPFSVASL